MVLKRFTGLLNKRSDDDAGADQDSPEANASRGVRLFCESGSPNNATEEVQYLPDIVTAAESSPTAAAACAYQIRKFLSKENYSKPHVQYNAVMLIRILADNPGPTFTRNINDKFILTVKNLLQSGKNDSVQQILRETLYALEKDKAYDTNLNPLFAMWRREQLPASYQGRSAAGGYGPRTLNAPPWNPNDPNQQGGFMQPPPQPPRSRSRPRQGLPPPVELAARIEEAKTSAKLLMQLVQSTPPPEIPANDLVKEFGERCQQAQRSIQNYINAEDPTPDDETMLTLIETNEQLSLALSKHQRALLGARRALSSNNVNELNGNSPGGASSSSGYGTTTSGPPSANPAAAAAATTSFAPPPGPPPHMQASLARHESAQQPQPGYSAASSTNSHSNPTAIDDPFADPHEPQHYGRQQPTLADPRSAYADLGTDDHTPDDEYPNPHHPVNAAAADGANTAVHPAYRSTPSYLARQESAGANRTMHGAYSPVDEDASVSAGTGTVVSGVSAVGEEDGRAQGQERYAGAGYGGHGDVSPVEERRVVYRY